MFGSEIQIYIYIYVYKTQLKCQVEMNECIKTQIDLGVHLFSL